MEPGDHNRFSTFNGLRIPDVTAMFYTQAEARCGPRCCCWELGLKVGHCVSEQGSDAEMSRQGWARAERRWAIMRTLLGFVQVWDSNGGSDNWVKTSVLTMKPFRNILKNMKSLREEYQVWGAVVEHRRMKLIYQHTDLPKAVHIMLSKLVRKKNLIGC